MTTPHRPAADLPDGYRLIARGVTPPDRPDTVRGDLVHTGFAYALAFAASFQSVPQWWARKLDRLADWPKAANAERFGRLEEHKESLRKTLDWMAHNPKKMPRVLDGWPNTRESRGEAERELRSELTAISLYQEAAR